MKKVSLALVVAFISTLILDSCTVQKRYHRKGFNVNWNHTSIGGKKDKNKLNNDFEEEIAELKTNNSPLNEVKSENSNYSNELFADSENRYVELSNSAKESTISSNNQAFISKIKTNEITTSKSSQAADKKLTKKKIIKNSKKNNSSEVPTILLFILCFLIPPLAVGLATDWNLTPVLWNIVWCILCGVPGIIHAIIHVLRNR